ncbi:MAG: Uncharacterised protein [Bacteroidetes bacterium MED-G17]|nr:MAG: Uncharacterised protein [Bacteroidetes bacterium MED-G17]
MMIKEIKYQKTKLNKLTNKVLFSINPLMVNPERNSNFRSAYGVLLIPLIRIKLKIEASAKPPKRAFREADFLSY